MWSVGNLYTQNIHYLKYIKGQLLVFPISQFYSIYEDDEVYMECADFCPWYTIQSVLFQNILYIIYCA